MVTWPWAFLIGRLIDESMWETFPNLKRWVDEVHQRPAVLKGRKIGEDLGKRELSEEEEKAEKKASRLRPQPRKASTGVKTLGAVSKTAKSEMNDLEKLWTSAPDVSNFFGN